MGAIGFFLRRIAPILILVGAILMIILGILGVLGIVVTSLVSGASAGLPGSSILTLVLGFVAVAVRKRVDRPLWAVALILIGFVGGGLGGILVLLGALLVLLLKYVPSL